MSIAQRIELRVLITGILKGDDRWIASRGGPLREVLDWPSMSSV